jgi:hypothetical protein
MNAEVEIQKAIYDTLANDYTLSALVTGVYDSVPQAEDAGTDTAFPYITVGDDTALDWNTDTSNGKEATITIHSWSRYRGRAEVKEIQGAIYQALHLANISVQGYNLVECWSEYSETLVDPDGLTRHGVQRFRMIIDKEI